MKEKKKHKSGRDSSWRGRLKYCGTKVPVVVVLGGKSIGGTGSGTLWSRFRPPQREAETPAAGCWGSER